MSESSDWRDLSRPDVDPRELFEISPFTRLARTHVFSVAGDALFTIGLAGTVFFGVDLSEARWQVALTLLLTIAPFAVAAPLIGPTLDRMRGGRRWMIVGTTASRAVISLLLIQNFDNLMFYPLAFLMLVMQKSYQIAKSAIVPTTVRNDAELVQANSKLSLLSGLAVVVAAIPGGLLWKFGGSDWVVGFGTVIYLVAATLGLRVPATLVAEEPADATEKAELRSVALLLAATAMGLLRGIVGFLAFLLAFNYKGEDPWQLGVILVMAQAGFLVGAALAPRVRKVAQEEHILIGVLLTVMITGIGAAFTGGLVVASLMSFTVGAGSSAGKQAFDAIVQRDAPDANRGRSFARFETRFQLMWVVGALIPVVSAMPALPGFGVIGLVAGFSAISYYMGLRSASVKASSIIRRQRRRSLDDAEDQVARDLGFEHGMVAEGTGVGDTGGASAAASAAERRRGTTPEQKAEESDVRPVEEDDPTDEQPPPGEIPPTTPADDTDELPDLDWNP